MKYLKLGLYFKIAIVGKRALAIIKEAKVLVYNTASIIVIVYYETNIYDD